MSNYNLGSLKILEFLILNANLNIWLSIEIQTLCSSYKAYEHIDYFLLVMTIGLIKFKLLVLTISFPLIYFVAEVYVLSLT